MIRADHLVKTFARTEGKKNHRVEFMAVNDISLEVHGGEILGILGPNGAGKTTLLRMLGGLMEPSSGSVEVYGNDSSEALSSLESKKNIGYLSGNTKLYGRFSGRELMQYWGEFYELPKDEVEERIEEISNALELGGFLDNRIEKLSTGQTQRISIARCLLPKPQIYIFDEPTSGLDVISSRLIIDFMKKEKEAGKAVLYSTHYMEEAQTLCDRILMIHEGRIVASGTPLEIEEATHTDNLRDAFFAIIEGEEEGHESKEN